MTNIPVTNGWHWATYLISLRWLDIWSYIERRIDVMRIKTYLRYKFSYNNEWINNTPILCLIQAYSYESSPRIYWIALYTYKYVNSKVKGRPGYMRYIWSPRKLVQDLYSLSLCNGISEWINFELRRNIFLVLNSSNWRSVNTCFLTLLDIFWQSDTI